MYRHMNKRDEGVQGTDDGFLRADQGPGMLQGVRVLEVSDETGEYCGLLLAGMGASVKKIERPDASPSREIGPFAQTPDGRRVSLHFAHYNRGKEVRRVDLDGAGGDVELRELLRETDVVIDAGGTGILGVLGLSSEALAEEFPRLIHARLTPFGEKGPWAKFQGSDLVHLALGGVLMNCGYDPRPTGEYDLPPMAPQMWQAHHIACEQLTVGIMAAVVRRLDTGRGQTVSQSVHEAVSKCTELDLMSWVMRRATLHRQTCRHAAEIRDSTPSIGQTKDGRWFVSLLIGARDQASLVPFLHQYGMSADLVPPEAKGDANARDVPGTAPADERKSHALEVTQRFVRSWCYDDVPWLAAQEAGLLWAPLRKPHENSYDPHWLERGTFADVHNDELGRDLRHPVSKWLSTATSWQSGALPKAADFSTDADRRRPARRAAEAPDARPSTAETLSRHGKPFALQGIRILDFSWFLASAGGTRFLTALGAETLKVEWKHNPDTRFGAMAPAGGRAARNAAREPLPGQRDPAMGGQFNNKNAGKRGISLNIRDPRGLELAKRLVAMSDVVAEGFSPGVLERLGLGYDVLKSIKPDIIYVQQSGMGSVGRYGRLRTVGPIAAAFTGLSEMSGLPEPAMPAGWGYSYLDWIGAYGFAQAILGAIHHRERTGEGQWIDSSQCEAGLFVTGSAIVAASATSEPFRRYGNRSPFKPAAPHGVYRCAGVDRWIAIACFDERDWHSLLSVAGESGAALRQDTRFATLESRLQHQDDLDMAVQAWTATQDAYPCMAQLQAALVAAGVCQTAEDRCDRDPQLAADRWLTEVRGTAIGDWPIAELPFRMSETPPHIGGAIDRGAPLYGEDNEAVFGELLGLSPEEIAQLASDGVI